MVWKLKPAAEARAAGEKVARWKEMGEYIKERRKEEGLTVKQLAAKMRASETQVCELEKGRRALTLDLARKLTMALPRMRLRVRALMMWKLIVDTGRRKREMLELLTEEEREFR